jgi:branched-chain amino acid transport system ATP-binding protein
MSGPAPVLEASRIGKHYGGITVLEAVTFEVAKGSRLGLIGPNGAGKTTLFNVITGEIRPDEGAVRLLGQDVTASSPQERVRLGLGRTYQITKTFPSLSVRENIVLGLMGQTSRKYNMMRNWMALSDIEEAVASVAKRFGLLDILERTASALSHGEIRELEVAIALSVEPEVLLLDEPAAGLSPGERSGMSALIRSLPHEMTVIMVEHDMDIVREVVDQVIVLHAGRVIFQGSVAEASEDVTVRNVYVGRS